MMLVLERFIRNGQESTKTTMSPTWGAGMTDWRELLKKYIKHVGHCEGVSFIGPHETRQILTEKEMETLEALHDEVRVELGIK